MRSLGSGVTNKKKNAAWENVTSAVNAVGSEESSVSEIKKKWFDIKLSAKKHLAAHKRDISASGGGQSTAELIPSDTCMASIISDTALCGNIEHGDTDTIATEQAWPSNIRIDGKKKKKQNFFC